MACALGAWLARWSMATYLNLVNIKLFGKMSAKTLVYHLYSRPIFLPRQPKFYFSSKIDS